MDDVTPRSSDGLGAGKLFVERGLVPSETSQKSNTKMKMNEKLIRSCTLTENVQDLLLEYIKDNDLEELENLLQEDKLDVNHVYKDATEFYYEEKNVLQIACAYFYDEINEKCIQILLDYGADIFYKDPETQKNALNFAAESGNEKILEVILKYIHKKQINITNSNVIYSAIKNIRDAEDTEEKFITILKQLLEADIDINYEDTHSGWTAIYMAAKYKFKNVVQTIIDAKKDEINLDEFKDKKGKSARDLIIEEKLYLGALPPFAEENSNITVYTLYKNIRNRSIEYFTQNFETIEDILNENDKYKLLNMAVKYHLERAVKFLLNNGVHYEKYYVNNDDNPMIITTQRGYHKILKLFMRTKPNSDLVSQSIFKLLKTPQTAEQSENVNYSKCLTLLLKSENLDINAKDYNNNTALHYALRYHDSEMVLKILRKGATLASRDSFNRLAVAEIDSQTLETHLNECFDYEYNKKYRIDLDVRFNFTSLLPTEYTSVENKNEKTVVDLESQPSTIISDVFVPETEVLEYMCTSEQLKKLFKHPVIVLFVLLKWYRIAKLFYINLSLFILFFFSLLCYITFNFNVKTETHHKILIDINYGILMFTFAYLVIREISQIILYKYKYFLIFGNLLEIVLLISTFGILVARTDENETLLRQFSAVLIVVAAIEFLLLVGQIPSMSTNILLLKSVTCTFFKLLLWYSVLLISFSYSFYILFQENVQEGQNNNGTVAESNEKDENQDFFENFGMSLLKTIVMLTGEFDAASINFKTYPVISPIIFVMFLFLIAIILLNLLNALAVSDTQIIINDAEIFRNILRVKHVAHIERTLLKNKFIQWMPALKKICLFTLHTESADIVIYTDKNLKLKIYMGENTQNIKPEIEILMKEIKELTWKTYKQKVHVVETK